MRHLILVVAQLTLSGCGRGERQGEGATKPAEVTTVTVAARDVPVSYEFVAQTQSSRQVNIQARVGGFLEKRVYTGDMDMTIRYWRDLLGMRLVAGLGGTGYRHYFFEISDTDLIAFFEWPGAEKIPLKDHGVPVKKKLAFDHVSIGVDTMEDLSEFE